MEILTPWSSKVHPEAQPKGVNIYISTDRNVNNEFIPGYGKNIDILELGEPRKSDGFFIFGKNSHVKKYESFECFFAGVGFYSWSK